MAKARNVIYFGQMDIKRDGQWIAVSTSASKFKSLKSFYGLLVRAWVFAGYSNKGCGTHALGFLGVIGVIAL